MRKCPKCGREFASKDLVCPDDGSVLQDTISPDELAIGKTLDGKYRIDGFLTRGGMGSVYRGTHVLLNKPIAIKLIRPELVTSHDMVERFFREARAAAKLSHPYIVTVHDLGQTDDGMLYIIMELVDGKSLKQVIQSDGPWSPQRALRFVRGIASALSLAHRNGIVHRDLKPQNIMVYRDSDGNESPKLLDFGIAKTLEPDSPALTSTGMVLGTPHYMSAEQAKGQPADQRSDLYALGIILYEMLVGKVPFDDKSIPSILVKHLTEPPRPPSTLKSGISPELERLVLRCLEKDPEKRFQSADELSKALTALVETGPQRALDPTIATVPPYDDSTLESTSAATMAGGGSASVPAPIPFPPPPPVVVEDTKRMDSGTVRARQVKTPGSVSPVAPRPAPAAMTYETPTRGPLIVLLVLLSLIGAAAVFLIVRSFGGGASSSREASLAPSVTEPAADTATETPAPEPDSTPEAVNGGGNGTGTGEGTGAESVAALSTPSEPAVESPGSTPTTPPPPPPPPKSPTKGGSSATKAKAPPSPSDSTPRSTQTTRPAEVQPPPEAPIPEHPAVSVECAGVKDACGALREALQEELGKQGMQVVRAPRGDVLVDIETEEVEARSEQQFGNTFIIRTYSVTLDAQAPRFGDSISLSPRTFSFDARLGREKLRAEAYVTASDAASRIAKYWESKRPR
jgi:eukaryotic-like serine/threonine-protein kinase